TFLEGNGSHDRSHHHLSAGCEVLSVLDRPRQMKDRQPRPLEGNRVAHGMITAGDVGFDVVRQGIKPRPCGDLWRHAKGQFRVGKRHAGDQVRTKENCLAIGGLEDDPALLPTSLPVPEVVAMAIMGGMLGPILSPPFNWSSYCSSGSG